MLDPGLKILVLNEMKVMRKLVVKSLMELELYNIVEASSWGELTEILDQHPSGFDLVICARSMHDFTYRSDFHLIDTPFILTTSDTVDLRIKRFNDEIDHFLTIPFDRERLSVKIQLTLKSLALRCS